MAHVFYLSSLADSREAIARTTARESTRAVVVGVSFIGLEVAAFLRTRSLEVHVAVSDAHPLGRVLGPEMRGFLRTVHEEHGLHFHLVLSLKAIEERTAVLYDGSQLPADLIVTDKGVRPSLALVQQAGSPIDRGVVVNKYLETSAPDVYAAGDIARWMDPRTGKYVRIEHWIVAERQGQTAARNMVCRREAFLAVPFFWSQHHGLKIGYVGHAESWERIDVAGSIAGRNCLLVFRGGGRLARRGDVLPG